MADDSKTQTYSSGSESDFGKTQVYQGSTDDGAGNDTDNGKTQVYQADATVETRIDRTRTHNLGIGDRLTLGSHEYTVTGIISGEGASGEAVVFKVEDASRRAVALKLYFPFNSAKDEPNTEALRRVKPITDADILALIDYGTGAEKYQGKFCYEVSAFAEGGDLLAVGKAPEELRRKYTESFVRNSVVPQLFKGIRKLHAAKIYHCDLKPQNVFFLDAAQTDLVIGDYGSSQTVEQTSAKGLSQVSVAKGTNFYLAPEQARGIISEKNDYYSFGMVLLHLLYPEEVNADGLRRIIERQFAKKPVLDFNRTLGDLNTLIAGLTLQDIDSRWGEEEVSLWMSGKSPEVSYAAASALPIKLGATTIHTPDDLITYIETDEGAYDNLFGDAQGYSELLRWVMQHQDLEHKRVFEQMIKYYAQDGKEYVREAVIRYFQPVRPVRAGDSTFDIFTGNWVETVDAFFAAMEKLWQRDALKPARFSLFQLEFALHQAESLATGDAKRAVRLILEKISAAMGVAGVKTFENYKASLHTELDNTSFLALLYAFNKERAFRGADGSEHKALEEVGFYFARNRNAFDIERVQHELEAALRNANRAELIGLSYTDFLLALFAAHVAVTLEFVETSVRGITTCEVRYEMARSLQEFFRSKGIENEVRKEVGSDSSENLTQDSVSNGKRAKRKKALTAAAGVSSTANSKKSKKTGTPSSFAEFNESVGNLSPSGTQSGSPVATVPASVAAGNGVIAFPLDTPTPMEDFLSRLESIQKVSRTGISAESLRKFETALMQSVSSRRSSRLAVVAEENRKIDAAKREQASKAWNDLIKVGVVMPLIALPLLLSLLLFISGVGSAVGSEFGWRILHLPFFNKTMWLVTLTLAFVMPGVAALYFETNRAIRKLEFTAQLIWNGVFLLFLSAVWFMNQDYLTPVWAIATGLSGLVTGCVIAYRCSRLSFYEHRRIITEKRRDEDGDAYEAQTLETKGSLITTTSLLVTASVVFGFGVLIAMLYAAGSGGHEVTLKRAFSQITKVRMFGDKTYNIYNASDKAHHLLYSASANRLVHVTTRSIDFYSKDGLPAGSLSDRNVVKGAALTGDGKMLAVATIDGIALYQVGNNRAFKTLDASSGVTEVAYSPDGSWVAGASAKKIVMWNATTGKSVRSFETPKPVTHLAVSPDSKTLAASADGYIYLWNAEKGSEPSVIDAHGTNKIRSIQFSPDGKRLVTGSADNTAKVWDASTLQLTRSFDGSAQGEDDNYDVAATVFSPNGKTLAVGCNDGTVYFYEVESGLLIHSIKASDLLLCFSADGTRLYGWLEKSGIDLWNMADATSFIANAATTSGAVKKSVPFKALRYGVLLANLNANPEANPEDELLRHGSLVGVLKSQGDSVEVQPFIGDEALGNPVWMPARGISVLNTTVPDTWDAEVYRLKPHRVADAVPNALTYHLPMSLDYAQREPVWALDTAIQNLRGLQFDGMRVMKGEKYRLEGAWKLDVSITDSTGGNRRPNLKESEYRPLLDAESLRIGTALGDKTIVPTKVRFSYPNSRELARDIVIGSGTTYTFEVNYPVTIDFTAPSSGDLTLALVPTPKSPAQLLRSKNWTLHSLRNPKTR